MKIYSVQTVNQGILDDPTFYNDAAKALNDFEKQATEAGFRGVGKIADTWKKRVGDKLVNVPYNRNETIEEYRDKWNEWYSNWEEHGELTYEGMDFEMHVSIYEIDDDKYMYGDFDTSDWDSDSTVACLNFYECPECGHKFKDAYECEVDGECTECGHRHLSPVHTRIAQ